MKLSARFLAALVLLATAPAAAGPGQSPGKSVILIDYSGSMKGFENTGALASLVATLRRAVAGSPAVLWTVSQRGQPTRLVPDGENRSFGGETRLYESVRTALDQHGGAASLWLLTDNIPSHESPDQDLDRLYDWLRRSGSPHAVTLFALKLPFQGVIFRADGHTRLSSDYRGDRAAVLYAALLDLGARTRYVEDLERVAAALNGGWPHRTLRLRCKPLQSDSVEMAIEDGSMHLAPDGTLEGKGEEGEPFRGTFKVLLRSKMDHVQFLDVKPSFTLSSKFRTNDFDTSEVGASLDERNVEEIGKGWVGLEGVLTIAPARLRRTLRSAGRAFAKGDEPGKLEGYLDLHLGVDRKSVVILPTDLHDFSTSRSIFEDASPEAQSRVYRLQDLFQEKFVSDHLELVPTRGTGAAAGAATLAGRIPVRIAVAYSAASAWVLLRPVLLALAAAAALIALMGWLGSGRYQLIGEGFDDRPFRVRGSRPVRSAAGTVGTLFHLGPVLRFDAMNPWEIDGEHHGLAGPAGGPAGTRPIRRRRLPSDGGNVDLRRRGDDRRVSFRVVRVGAGAARQKDAGTSFLR